jgi:hypothetical protein
MLTELLFIVSSKLWLIDLVFYRSFSELGTLVENSNFELADDR